MQLFDFHKAQGKPRAILISVPHAGTYIPDAIARRLPQEMRTRPIDTDWYVDELYTPLAAAGISCIVANYSRFVIDLNRDPSSKKLYDDNRPESTLVPTHTFAGQPLYAGEPPDVTEIQDRTREYYEPYYERITQELASLRQQFRQVLFYDAHSIKRLVATIRSEPFPDMILGNQDGRTCDDNIIATARTMLAREYQVQVNDPFKGGQLTRYFGRPADGIHAMQLEMSQDIYMDENTLTRDTARMQTLSQQLTTMLLHVADVVEQLP